MSTTRWARVIKISTHGLRRGAWYPVLADEAAAKVLLDVDGVRVPVDRDSVELHVERPRMWTVVRRGEGEEGRRSSFHIGPIYAVCPECLHRVRLSLSITDLTCPRCKQTFPVDLQE